MKIKISTDSTCDLPAELIAAHDIGVLPLYIIRDGEALRDGIDVTPDDLYAYTKATGKLCGTSAVTIADYLTELYSRYGISLAVTAQDMDTFLASRAAGGYSITRCSFSADVDDPMPFLSLWASGAGSNCVALGRGAHADYAGYSVTLDGRTRDNCTWAESYDALLYRIQSSGDTAERYSLMHQAETLLMQTGAVCPLYWYTDTYLCNTHVQGLLSGPLGAQYLMGAHVEK